MTLAKILIKHGVLGHYSQTIVRRVGAYKDLPLDNILDDFSMLSPATVAAVIADYTQTPLLKSEDLDTGQVPISWVDLRPTGTAARAGFCR